MIGIFLANSLTLISSHLHAVLFNLLEALILCLL